MRPPALYQYELYDFCLRHPEWLPADVADHFMFQWQGNPARTMVLPGFPVTAETVRTAFSRAYFYRRQLAHLPTGEAEAAEVVAAQMFGTLEKPAD